VDPLDQLDQEGLGQVPDALRVQVGEAELQHPGAQREQPAVGFGVAELAEREQQPARRGAGQAGAAGDLGQRHGSVLAVEGLDDRQPAREGLDEIGRLRG